MKLCAPDLLPCVPMCETLSKNTVFFHPFRKLRSNVHFRSSFISVTTKSPRMMTWFVSLITSSTIPFGIIIVPSTRVMVMFDGFNFTFLSFLNIDNDIKFTVDPRSHTADVKVIPLIEHGGAYDSFSLFFLLRYNVSNNGTTSLSKNYYFLFFKASLRSKYLSYKMVVSWILIWFKDQHRCYVCFTHDFDQLNQM